VQQISTHTHISIALVKRPQDWQRIEHTRRYHLPIRHVAHILQSPWIALYLPGWHTTHPHCIRHVASISALTIMPRHAYLSDEPLHPRAHQLYAILTLDALYELQVPIVSKRWRRISIHHTTWGALTRTYDLGNLKRIEQRMRSISPSLHDTNEFHDLYEPFDISKSGTL
jgi:hypothetical protein